MMMTAVMVAFLLTLIWRSLPLDQYSINGTGIYIRYTRIYLICMCTYVCRWLCTNVCMRYVCVSAVCICMFMYMYTFLLIYFSYLSHFYPEIKSRIVKDCSCGVQSEFLNPNMNILGKEGE